MRIKILFLSLFGLMRMASAQEPYIAPPETNEALIVLNKVIATYKAMPAYSATGAVISDKHEGNFAVQTTTTFTIKLKKPDSYLITWSQTSVPQALPQGGAVWKEGTQPFLYLVMDNAYSKIMGDVAALSAANAVSEGVSHTIPSVFFPAFAEKSSPFSRLRNPHIEKMDFVGGEECYVISSPSDLSKSETYWISKASNLILKYEKSLEPPPGGMAVSAVSDADLEKALQALGQPVNDESKKQMREMMKTAQGVLKNGDLTGTSTEVQKIVSDPDLTDRNFQFTPPKGATLTDSPMGPQIDAAHPNQPPPAPVNN